MYFNNDGGEKGKGREGVGVGRKQTPDISFQIADVAILASNLPL